MINFTKSFPGPNSLLEKKSWTEQDVIDQLRLDFHDKCYLCELVKPRGRNVEHFISRNKRPDLTYDWENLFRCCSVCNNTKLASFDNIINCINSTIKIDETILHRLESFPKEIVTFTKIIENEQINNTIELLNRIHNAEYTILKTMEAADLREKISDELEKFRELITQFNNTGIGKEEIILALQSDKPFTAFKKQIIRDYPILMPEFSSYL